MHNDLLFIALASLGIAAGQYSDCVLAGPDLPAPLYLSNSSVLVDAIARFNDLVASESAGLQAADTAWSAVLFSSNENKTLYERYYTPPIDVGVSKVDQDTIFRIGSVSKVFTVWSFLAVAGDRYFNDPITKYVPELANQSFSVEGAQDGVIDDNISHVRWEDVTLGELASHAAGIARDSKSLKSSPDLAVGITPLAASFLGFPIVNSTEIPSCSLAGANACTAKDAITQLLKQHPLYPTASSPAYSNVAFTLLGYAQEAIMGKGLNDTVTTNIFKPLGMENSSFQATPISGGVIPGNNASEVGWDTDLGQNSPSGSVYSSAADMIKAGQAILQSTLLSPSQTRRWFKPLVQTGYLSTAVGAPWEIRYLEFPNNRMVQLLTKEGDLGTYHAALILSPEHGLGWVVLTAGTPTANASSIRTALTNAFGDIFLPAAQNQTGVEAGPRFAGEYVDTTTNSSVTILAGDNGRPGLGVPSLISRGVELIGPASPLIQVYGAGQQGRLYPSQLRTVSRRSDGQGSYESRLGFRATFFNETQPGAVQDPCIMAWTALGAPVYGQRSLDDWVFEMQEDGIATALEVRMLRIKLARVQ
ncbi:beta-lactamase/transpeptidase-like protein [Thozetella sp. PMI_491]|nr:beta-lactamase/transpeptidase-like protein [Thozetella sp. PMI_491]